MTMLKDTTAPANPTETTIRKLDFSQLGLITFCFQLTASLLQPFSILGVAPFTLMLPRTPAATPQRDTS
jgi:hypothetical protein